MRKWKSSRKCRTLNGSLAWIVTFLRPKPQPKLKLSPSRSLCLSPCLLIGTAASWTFGLPKTWLIPSVTCFITKKLIIIIAKMDHLMVFYYYRFYAYVYV
uniref:Uncharacterized protein n=1 Tax=Medicago truncatula TaxID=3880 RepID=I3STR4_MEDTR|nr:unknown [Medicago truncatula]